MTEEYLLSVGYKKISDNVFVEIDEETGMEIELVFNPNGSLEENRRIEENVIKILLRQDI